MSMFICNECEQIFDSDEIETFVDPLDDCHLICDNCHYELYEN